MNQNDSSYVALVVNKKHIYHNIIKRLNLLLSPTVYEGQRGGSCFHNLSCHNFFGSHLLGKVSIVNDCNIVGVGS